MALRALKTEDELLAVPLNEPVLVELPTLPGAADDEGAGLGDKEPLKVAEKGTDAPADDGAAKLKEHLDAMTAANARADKAERDAAEARRVAKERDDENKALKAGRVEDEGELIQSALATAQSEERAAQADYEKAFEAGDAKAAAAAQSKMGRASAKIVQYENAAAHHATEVERAKTAPKVVEREAPQQLDPASTIDSHPQLLPSEKTWLKSHLDAWTDPQKNKELDVAYNRSIKAGHARGSAEQFKYIEEFMGYAKPAQTNDNEGDDNVSVAAPPSRQDRGTDGRPNSNLVTLSPEQREIARNMGVTDTEYARQVKAFEAAKKADPEKYSNR